MFTGKKNYKLRGGGAEKCTPGSLEKNLSPDMTQAKGLYLSDFSSFFCPPWSVCLLMNGRQVVWRRSLIMPLLPHSVWLTSMKLHFFAGPPSSAEKQWSLVVKGRFCASVQPFSYQPSFISMTFRDQRIQGDKRCLVCQYIVRGQFTVLKSFYRTRVRSLSCLV